MLSKQRARWHRGLTEILVQHRSMILRPRYGFIGMVTMRRFLLSELLAPVVEVFGPLYFAVVMVLLGLGGLGVVPGPLVAAWAAIEENLGHRQLTAFWRVRGGIEAIRKSSHVWGDVKRKGFEA